VWRVLPVQSPVRAVRAVLMYNGNVLLVAGSGNDPADFAAGIFESAVYNPNKGTFKVIKTPDDLFRAGEVQLPNGKVLILGGNKAYVAAAQPDQRERRLLGPESGHDPHAERRAVLHRQPRVRR
jgi:hypothetical protein